MRSFGIIASVVITIVSLSMFNSFVITIIISDIMCASVTTTCAALLYCIFGFIVPFLVASMLINVYRRQFKKRIQRLKDKHNEASPQNTTD